MQAYKCVNTFPIYNLQHEIKAQPIYIAVSIKQAISNNKFVEARNLLKDMIFNDMENAQAYNLLGILYEKEGNRKSACKYYRVAYYMDQTYSAACKNLDRVCEFYYNGANNIEWGLDNLEVKK